MLQTQNIPSKPLPDVPSAQPGVPGDAGERAEFAQLLQQAKSVDGAHEHDEAAVPPTKDGVKDAHADHRVRPGPARTAQQPKPHDVRRGRAEAEPAEDGCEGIDEAACRHAQLPAREASAIAVETVVAAQTPQSNDDSTAAPTPDALPLPVLMHSTEPLPAATTVSAAATATSDVRGTSARLGARSGARDLRLPTRADADTTSKADNGATQALMSPDITLPHAKDTAFDLALRNAGGGRGAGAPLFDRLPTESTPAAAQAIAFARELAQPMARTNTVAEAALQAAPDEAAFAPALGTQVALWVKDGVQEARLQLHPAELGPVSVQIALVGQAAHVDFTAAVAATRESIEQSLPALAAALRESGFTLAGGGVFGGSANSGDSGRQRTPDGRGTRGTSALGAEGAGEAVTATTPRRWARSLVDVYA
jgi:flagellar hook-length control protein FliK